MIHWETALLALGALIVILALAWDNRHHAHVWSDEEESDETDV